MRNILIGLILSLAWPHFLAADEPTLAIVNANIVTMNSQQPQAQAILVGADGKIAAVGSSADIKSKVDQKTKVIDADGKFLMPGFIEGHGHFLRLGESRMMLDLTQATSWDDIVEQVRLASETTPPGKWIVGRGWHQSKWKEKPTPNVEGYPTHETLSKASPNNPVLLTHASGHMDFANAYAMRLAEIDDKTENPKGGEILRSADKSATGVFRERASGLIWTAKYRDQPRGGGENQLDYLTRAAELASAECVSKGITSFQDAGSSFSEIEFLKLAVGLHIQPRLWVMARDSNQQLLQKMGRTRVIGFRDHRFTCRAIKRSIDGALGAHGAWLLAPYQDLPTSSGLNTRSMRSLEEAAVVAMKTDCQFCVHAIGDRANREVLDLFERQFAANPSDDSRRWRIEHAQHIDPADIPRFAGLGVVASMQAIHCTSDAIFVSKRLGERRAKQGAYVWKSLWDSGAVVTNGTDTPVEDVDPLASFYATVTRRLTPDVTFYPEQCLSRQQALESYTIKNAYAAFEEDIKGSLEPGKLADFVILSNDLLTCTDEEIKTTQVLKTFIGGDLVFEKDN